MDNMHDDAIDRALLARRELNDADGAAFIDRILRAAALTPANTNVRLPWYAPLLRFLDELLPAPAVGYAMPALMVLGIAIGFMTGADTTATTTDTNTIQSLLYSSEGML